jgi:hypothetical protein
MSESHERAYRELRLRVSAVIRRTEGIASELR